MPSSRRCSRHEVAHALREHTRERVSRAYAQQLVLSGAAAVTGVSEGTANIANMVAEVTFQLPFSRDQESEADNIGLELMARAGYDPRAALTLWSKMSQRRGVGHAQVPEHAPGARRSASRTSRRICRACCRCTRSASEPHYQLR